MNESLPYYEQMTPAQGATMFLIIVTVFVISLYWDQIKEALKKITGIF